MNSEKGVQELESAMAKSLAGARQRLEEIRAVVDGGFVKTPAEKREILKKRAIALAKSQERDESCAGIEVVTFQLAHEQYAIESKYIGEVHPLTTLTPIPCTPPFILGVVNLRGLIISVIDLKVFFELPGQGFTNLNRLIILEAREMTFGILADQVLGATTIPILAIQPSLPTLTDIRAQYLRGVSNERLIILDGNKLLTDRKIVIQ